MLESKLAAILREIFFSLSPFFLAHAPCVCMFECWLVLCCCWWYPCFHTTLHVYGTTDVSTHFFTIHTYTEHHSQRMQGEFANTAFCACCIQHFTRMWCIILNSCACRVAVDACDATLCRCKNSKATKDADNGLFRRELYVEQPPWQQPHTHAILRVCCVLDSTNAHSGCERCEWLWRLHSKRWVSIAHVENVIAR